MADKERLLSLGLKEIRENVFAHPTSFIDEDAQIGDGTIIWRYSQVLAGAKIGSGCSIGFSVSIDRDVVVGDNCKIQNGCQLYTGLVVGNDVFIGPNVTFTNDIYPDANNSNFTVVSTMLEDNCAIGAGSTIVCGAKIGKRALIGAGSLVVGDIPHGVVAFGAPAKVKRSRD